MRQHNDANVFGYRYIDMAGKDGNRDNTLADGAYAGVNFRF